MLCFGTHYLVSLDSSSTHNDAELVRQLLQQPFIGSVWVTAEFEESWMLAEDQQYISVTLVIEGKWCLSYT